MKPVISRIRSLFIPCTLALIFGALLLQSDQASMKGADKLQLSQSTSSPSARTNKPVQPIATKRFDAVEASSAPNAFFVPLMSASKSVNLATASPGNTLTYNINITNSGGTATTGVLFSDTIDANTTLVPGSVNTSPLALTDSYACTGNLGITVPAASGVLINDFDPDGTIPVIVAVNTAGTQGTVSLNPGNGSFTFNPAPGFEGTTTFSYTLSDGVFSDIGTVSITVSGMIWFIDDSVAGPGDGRLSAPFNSVANFNSLASDDPGDNIFVYSGNYSGSSLVLLANQKLIGQGATASILTITGLSLPPFSNALPATGGTRPTLTNTATNVTVSTGNTIRGVNIQNTTAGSALLGTSFNNLTISDTTASSTNGTAAVNLDQGSGTASINVSFISVSANTVQSGIILSDTTGSFTVTGDGNTTVGGNSSGGTIQNTTTHGISLSNTQNISLTNLNIQNSADSGIFGSQVVNFTFDNGTINNSGTSLGAFDSNIAFSDGGVTTATSFVSGAVTITDSVLTLGYYDGVDIQNFTGTISNLTISNNTITSSASTATSKAPGIRVIAFGSAGSAASVTTATINNNVVTNFPSDSGIMFQCGNATSEASPSSTCGSGANPINITNNNISGQSAVNRIGTQGILFNVQGVGTGHFNVSGNSVMHTSGNSISHNVFGDAVVTTTINNNTVVSNNTLGSQGIAGGTSFTTGFTSTPSLTVTITNNNVSQTDGNGILMVARDLATGSLNISVKNNTVAAPLAGVRPGIRVDAGNTMGDNDVCLDISGNTSAGSGGTQGIGLRKQGTDSAINAFGIEGMAATATPGVEAFVAGLNPAGGGVLLISGTSGFTSCGSAPLAMPIDPTGESNSSGQAQQHIRQSGSAPNLFARLNNWRHSIYSAFAAPTNLNLKAVGEWFSPTVEASNATSLTTTTTMNATLSGETVNKAISVIPPGKTVQIRFQVTVDSPFPAGVCTVSNQGSVSGSGFTTFLTNAATTTILLAPTIGACPTNITNNTDPGLCTAAVTFATPTATGCPMPTVTCSPASGSAFAKGTTTVTCTATNGVSPNSTCSFTVTVNDNQGPTFAGCPTNINANTAAGLCTAPVTYTAPTATDVCDGARTVTCSPASGSSFPKGTTTVTCTASDTSGNSNSCSFTVTVADNQGPTLTACPSNISLNTAAGLCTAVATYTAPTANDVCDGARTVTCSPASGTAFAKGTTTVTCTTSDTSGNNSSCSFTVTVADNQAPVVTCPGPISLTESSPGSGSATATFSATANDVCDGTRTVTCSPASGSSFPVGVTTVTCSASDLSGNSGSCSFTVTVGIACSITCPTNIVTNTAAGQCGANINYSTPTATGCGTVTCTPAANSFFPKGTTTVNCTTTAGPSCSFTVTVNDNQGPALTACPGNIALNTAAGLCTAVATYSAPTANDACDGARTVTCSPASGTAFAKGVTTVTCTTSDTSGNNSSCSFTVTVADNQAPTVTCPSPISLTESSPGSGSATATFSATANDVCDGTRTVTCSPASGSSFPVGVTTVNCSASDLSGNSGSCSFTVTVASACAISCPANINANTNPGQCTTNVSYSTPNPAGCGTVTCSPASGSLFAIGTTTVTCNTTAGPSCSFTVTVSDNQAPTVSCPANVNAVTNNTSGACSASGVSLGTASAVDNCGGTLTATGARSDSQPLSAPYPVGTTTITWSATDAAGNTGSCTQTVTVTNPNPVVSITGPASGSLFPINTAVTFTGSYTDNTGTHSANWMFDSATVAGTVNQTLKTVTASYSFATPGVYLVSLTVNDNCGGSGSANTIGGLDAFVVVYDPNGGFVTGGGWINSPAGAYVLDPSLTGKATFGFVSKYKRGSSVPTGETEFQFKAANLNFKSTVYEWLVVSGARAQYKGSGTINNTGDYRFILTAIDGQISGGGGQDKLRMKIWDNSGGGLVYDNLFNAPDSSNPTTVLGGGSIVIHAANGQNGNAAAPTVVSDFDGDGKTDLAVWDGVRGHWQIIQSSTGSANSIFWGAAADPYNDVMVPGDYDGDGQTDAAVFRRSTGYWLIKRSSDGQSAWQLWGYATDTVVPADYDGDGKTDIAVWRGSEGRWYIRRSSDNQVQNIQWGASNAPYLDVPVPADYDGDGKADLAVFRRSAGYWLIKSSADGSVSWKQLGTKSDVPVPADYDGDGKADVAIWDGNSTYWHIINSSDGSTRDVIWGRFSLGDIATPGDFDGDGIADIAVWRSSAATWYIIQSQTQTVLVRRHGAAGNTPVTRR